MIEIELSLLSKLTHSTDFDMDTPGYHVLPGREGGECPAPAPFKFTSPAGVMIAGPSQCGKSELVSSIIRHRQKMFQHPPQEIIFVYSCWQSNYEKLQGDLGNMIKFRTDIPGRQELTEIYNEDPVHRLLVIDDKFTAFKNGKQGSELVELAAVITHHCKFTAFYITQNLFHSPIQKEIGLQCQYTIIFKNPRSQQQVGIFGNQLLGKGNSDFFIDAYRKATARPHGFLLVDLAPCTTDKMRLKSCIIPGEQLIVYLPTQ